MRRYHKCCHHIDTLSIINNVKICKKCSVLTFNSVFFAKPSVLNQPAEINAISVIRNLIPKIENKKRFSDAYKAYRYLIFHHIKGLCVNYKVSTRPSFT